MQLLKYLKHLFVLFLVPSLCCAQQVSRAAHSDAECERVLATQGPDWAVQYADASRGMNSYVGTTGKTVVGAAVAYNLASFLSSWRRGGHGRPFRFDDVRAGALMTATLGSGLVLAGSIKDHELKACRDKAIAQRNSLVGALAGGATAANLRETAPIKADSGATTAKAQGQATRSPSGR
jgi:hypothetical protein